MSDRRMSSLSKGLKVIQKFAFEKESWGIRELARELGFSKSAALRLLQSLCDEGYLSLGPEDSRYRIGPELWRLGVALRDKDNLYGIAMSAIRKYASSMNEMMIFFRYSGGSVVYEGVAECEHALRFTLKLGIPYDIRRGPAGKTILAFLPPGESSALLEALGEDASVDLARLREQVVRARLDGYSWARGERESGVIGFAAPIVGPEGRFLGGVGLYLPEARYDEARSAAYADAVKACAREISSIANAGRG